MSKSYIPSRNADLIPWAANLSSKISATPTAYGLSTGQATSLASAYTSLSGTFTTATTPSTRTKGTIEAFHASKKSFLSTVRPLVGIVQKFPGLTDAQRADLGITIRAAVHPINPPTESPNMEIVSANGRTLKLKLHSSTTDRKKPTGVAGATVWSFIGATPPADINAWVNQGSTTRTIFDVAFPSTVAAGSQVWLTASWFNPRNQTGPACTPISAYIAGGVAMAA